MVNILNLTGHPVQMVTLDGQIIDFPKEPRAARIPQRRETVSPIHDSGTQQHIDAVEIRATGRVKGLPPPRANTMYIVSRIVFLALPHRTDLLVPDGAVRDKRGNVIAARRFICRSAA